MVTLNVVDGISEAADLLGFFCTSLGFTEKRENIQ